MSKVTRWKFLTSSQAAWEHMIESCRRAEHSIDIEQFVFGNDGAIIETLTDVLKAKTQQGVRVRLLLDAVGSFLFFQSHLRTELEKGGIEIVFHRTVIPPTLKRLIPFLLRDHRKLLIFDRKEAHIGGVIIQERARSWRDTAAVLEGTIVDDCLRLFDSAWGHAERMSPIGPVLSSNGKGEFYLVGNSFRLRDKHLYRSIVRGITEAKNNIYLTTPYFALTHDLRRALWYAQKRGAEIVLLLPKRSDNFFADCIGRLYYARLLRRKIKIFHYTKSILHAKTISIDGKWATVGSCNLDWLSTWLNYELNVVSENTDFATELEAIFMSDIQESEEVTFATRGWWGMW